MLHQTYFTSEREEKPSPLLCKFHWLHLQVMYRCTGQPPLNAKCSTGQAYISVKWSHFYCARLYFVIIQEIVWFRLHRANQFAQNLCFNYTWYKTILMGKLMLGHSVRRVVIARLMPPRTLSWWNHYSSDADFCIFHSCHELSPPSLILANFCQLFLKWYAPRKINYHQDINRTSYLRLEI